MFTLDGIKQLALAASLLGLPACDITQTKEAELPTVDVDVEEGQMPDYEVETADVEVTTETETVEVPEVEVRTVEEEVEVPHVEVTMPE